MASYNKVILMGNLTRDPELRYLPSGSAVANIGLAINRNWTDRESGEKREEVCFVDLEAFGRTAETMNEYLQKGRAVLIEGRLRYRTWETDDGQRRSKHDIFVERFQFVGGRQDGGESGEYSQQGDAAPQASSSGAEPTTEDDIPF
ncbi:MAG: single-stranded DNA-binding protein [Candidatus Poribacteria bacterium]|nr:single-stranded DNA-binding protein [Candidatus Poribacteria bacterium]MDE0502556.1 single-stranded DNA-binding protein [Candidatus Poribacteria bacterium]